MKHSGTPLINLMRKKKTFISVIQGFLQTQWHKMQIKYFFSAVSDCCTFCSCEDAPLLWRREDNEIANTDAWIPSFVFFYQSSTQHLVEKYNFPCLEKNVYTWFLHRKQKQQSEANGKIVTFQGEPLLSTTSHSSESWNDSSELAYTVY